MVFLCADEREARQLAGDLQSLTGETPVTLLAREWQFRPNAVSSREWERSRLAALHQMAAGNAPIVVATVDALLARTMPPHRLAELSVTLETGGRADLKELTDRLLQAGYSRCDQVEGVGQFAVRGGILDVFSPLMEKPVRCELFGDEIDSMGLFIWRSRSKSWPSSTLRKKTERRSPRPSGETRSVSAAARRSTAWTAI